MSRKGADMNGDHILGIGSSLVDPRLVAAREFTEIENRASRFIQAVSELTTTPVA